MKLRAASLFEWPSRHNVHVALPLFLLFSFLVHAATVLIFQAGYPHTHTTPPHSAQVYFLRPGSAEAAAIAPMLAASDPSLFSPAQAINRHVWDLPEAGYVPSFDSQKPSLAPMPVRTKDPMVLEMILPQISPASPQLPLKSSAGLPTQVELGGELKGRTLTPPPGVIFSAPPRQGLAPVEFLVGVSPEGLPLHLFPQSSSGNEALDRAALAYLAKCRFAPVSAGQDSWGTATFHWGSDVERRKEP